MKTTKIKFIESEGMVLEPVIETISCATQAAHIFRQHIGNNINEREYFFMFLLDARNQLRKYALVGIGSAVSCIVDVSFIMRTAILHNCRNIIVAHNHPSGNLTPSTQDISLTEKIKKGGELFGIHLLDSLIVTENGLFSLVNDN